MKTNLRLVEGPADKGPKSVSLSVANDAMVDGNARIIIARNPPRGYRLKVCTWCRKNIEVGTVYVRAETWLRDKRGRWHEKGPRHRNCWELERNV